MAFVTPQSTAAVAAVLKNNRTCPAAPESSNSHNNHNVAFTYSTRPSLTPRHAAATTTTASSSFVLLNHSYYLTRVVFLRGLAFVYGVAFLVAWRQNRGLLGDRGITPARRVLDLAERRATHHRRRRDAWLDEMEKQNRLSGGGKGFRPLHKLGMVINRIPAYKSLRETLWDRADGMGRPVTTLLWLARDRTKLNRWLDGIALSGLGLALTVLALGSANVPLLLGLWLCQRSLMAVGGPFYGYGWEPQLAELGFYAMFLVPLLSLERYNMPMPMMVLWIIRFYLCKIMLGAGLIKIKSGEPKWRNLTAMDTFYETQPVPNPLTRYFHFLPRRWHQLEVLGNHFVELVAPFLLLGVGLPPAWRRAGGIIQLIFQCVLISSGNLSFLNWLTMVPAIMSLDDAVWSRFFSSSQVALAAEAAAAAGHTTTLVGTSPARQLVTVCLGALVARLSVPVVQNLLARKKQLMNASFDKLRLVNTYGAFGVVNDERRELIIKAASDMEGPWREYEFSVKPGDVMRRPRWISPYHYRLDWQMWIACTCRIIERSPWMYNFLIQLLERNEDVCGLLARDPFQDDDEAPPKYIRIDMYRYAFHKKKAGEKRPVPYWDREFLGRFYPRQGIATIGSLKEELKQGGRPRW